MFKLLILLFFVSIPYQSASSYLDTTLVGPGDPGVVLQGPGSRTAIRGPDGSHITSGDDGGRIVAPPKPGGTISHSLSPGYISTNSGSQYPNINNYDYGSVNTREGQYIDDGRAQQFNDGLYKPPYPNAYGGYDDGLYKGETGHY